MGRTERNEAIQAADAARGRGLTPSSGEEPRLPGLKLPRTADTLNLPHLRRKNPHGIGGLLWILLKVTRWISIPGAMYS